MDLISKQNASRKVIPLDQNWSFKQDDDPASAFRPVSGFPTNVHLDLLHHDMISDPFVGQNEIDCQWVGEVPWVYKTEFASPIMGTGKAVLAFEGLDTHATVRLNGMQILKTDNMFIPERVDVTNHIVGEGHNTLEISFASTYLAGKRIVQEHPDHIWGCWNGDPSRLGVRKAQYHYVNDM